MARTIALKFPAKCRDCGADLAVGDLARYYGRGRVYGTACHEKRGTARGGKKVWYGGVQVPATETATGMCEDAPCCGCCGPGSDDPPTSPTSRPTLTTTGGR